MSLVPEKLFVNLYPPAVGPCVGAAYTTRELADRNANSHRIMCVELSARPANTVTVSDACHATLAALAKRTGREPAWLIEHALAVHLAIPAEIRGLLLRYAAEHKVEFATAIAECCRGYLTEAAR